MAELELFRCERLATKLTRTSCTQRFRRARKEAGGRGAKGQRHLAAAGCTDCPIGAAHARGETPDVELVELAGGFAPGGSTLLGGAEQPTDQPAEQPQEPEAGPSPETDESADRREETRMPKTRRTYPYKGRELTAAELLELPEAKALGLTESTLYYRLKRMSPEKAVSTPKNVGGARKRARKAKPSRAAPTKPRAPETSSMSALRVVLYANGVEVAESSVVTTWLETMQRIQAEAPNG
ncbi:MAG: hypothetical protein VYE22_09675 [Myxococcota bacterium]|nr:hypothetical protein [Myxococcota bacterium]